MTNRLTDTIEETDIHFAKLNNTTPELCCFQKLYNPMTIYCRLRELGFETKEANIRSKTYEMMFYKPLMFKIEKMRKENIK